MNSVENLIIPREQINYLEYSSDSKTIMNNDLNKILQKNICSDLEKKVLVYSSGSNIYVLDDKTAHRISCRSKDVYSLCSHNGVLYDGGDYNSIFETLQNKKIALRNSFISSLCSHDGVLYDGGLQYGVFETFSNKNIFSNGSASLCSHEDILYGSTNCIKNEIYDVLNGEKIISKNEPIGSLCSHKGAMYYSGSFSRTIYELSSNEKVASRHGIIRNLYSFEDNLYDCGYYDCIGDTFKNKKILVENYIDSLNIHLDLIRSCGVPKFFGLPVY